MNRYGIAEWYGEPFTAMLPVRRKRLASIALDRDRAAPQCPFQPGNQPCNKRGGVCSLQRYDSGENGRIGQGLGSPVITCPNRFDEQGVVTHWLADVVGFDYADARIAHEVPFMRAAANEKAAGRIDMVLALDRPPSLVWYGLEIQAVYFSGQGMQSEFRRLLEDDERDPPFPDSVRRPDWRSSSAKRLMPQLQIKVPTLRRWGTKIAVAVDRPFFEAIGGASTPPIQDLDEGEVIWLVPELSTQYRLQRGHWEMLSLDESNKKLQAARTVRRAEFETTLRSKLEPL
jgi:hypothetical protein